jgi:hypothetical protein
MATASNGLPKKAKSGKKHRKYGRNIDKCAIYRAENRRFKNKIRRIARNNGAAAVQAYKELAYKGLLG